MCAHTHKQQSILCLVVRRAMPVVVLPSSTATHSVYELFCCLYCLTFIVRRFQEHSALPRMLSFHWSSHCIFILWPEVTQWHCPTLLCRGAAPFLSNSILVVSGLHQWVLKVLTLQWCGSKLSVALSVPGVYSNLGLVPCIVLPLPHHKGLWLLPNGVSAC